MATIRNTSKESVYTIRKWLGVNENPDGDTQLKLGEASLMRNWRITKDGHLQIRQGYAPLVTLGTTAVLGVWSGYINGVKKFIASCGGKLYSISSGVATEIGSVTGSYAHFFGFDKKLYLLTGSKYYVYDGTTLSEVTGYRPLTVIAAAPATGAGTALEQINKLNGQRRVRFSSTGGTTFQLPETGLTSIDYIKYVATGAAISTASLNTTTGLVTTSAATTAGTNNIEIGYTYPTTFRSQVEAMRFSETYNGSTDTRIFVYGDGSNTAFYSGIRHDTGLPSAEYFPDLNEMAVDSANTPITAMVKHYNSLLTFKSDSAYITNYGTITLADNTTTSAFYTTPLNRSIGNVALGQVAIIKNNPYTLYERSVFEWKLTSYAAKDERNADEISERVRNTLAELDLTSAICFDDEYNTEYYVCQNNKCVVYNYTADAWYIYTNIPATCFISIGGQVYFGTSTGKIMHLSRSYRNDNGTDIDARLETGAIDYGADYRLKYSSDIWIALKPESQARLTVTAQSNRKSDYEEKVVASALITFSNMDFNHFSFGTNRQPQTERVKLKVKKFTYYRLILTSVSSSATATVLGADMQVRFAGNVK